MFTSWNTYVPTNDGWTVVYDLKRLYAEPHRFYHTWQHITGMLELLEDAGAFNSLTKTEATILFWAVLFHDAIYNIPASPGTTNEMSSAALARGLLTNIVPNYMVTFIANAVLATDYKFAAPILRDRPTDLLCDADLVYGLKDGSHNKDVRRELAMYTKEQIQEGQVKFFTRLLEVRPVILHTPEFAMYDTQVRNTITGIINDN